MADTVGMTLGPMGRNVAYEQRSWEPPRVSKDGVTVAKEVELSDPFQDLGASLLYHIASNTNTSAGDGTTTATILAREFFKAGMQAIAAGFNPMDIKYGMNICIKQCICFLELIHEQFWDKDLILRVATISANGDEEIGKLVASGIELVGLDGVLQVEDGNCIKDELDVVEGVKYDRGYLSPYFITDSNKYITQFDKPLFLFYDKILKDPNIILNILDKCHNANRSLIIMAENVEGAALDFLVKNKLKAKCKVCAIKTPGGGDYKKHNLRDLSIITGGIVFTDAYGANKGEGIHIEQCQLTDLGEANKIVVYHDKTLIFGGNGDFKSIQDRIDAVKVRLETCYAYEKPKHTQRLANLQGGIGIIKVGGTSEVAIHEKKDRVIDALNCVKSAIDQGILPGAGFALFYSSLFLKNIPPKLQNEDQCVALEIVKKALQLPAKMIINNAGQNGPWIIQEMQCRIEDICKENKEFEKYIYNRLQEIAEKNKKQRIIIHSHGDDEYEKNAINYANVDPQVLYETNNEILDMNLDRFGKVSMDLKVDDDIFKDLENNDNENILQRDIIREVFHYGYDAKYKTYCNLMEYGVIDPLKVTTNALIDANSVSGMMITTESVVVDVPTPYHGPPDVEVGERADPAKHKVPEGWSYERELEKQWRNTERAKEQGRYEEKGEDAPENPMDLINQLPGGFAAALPHAGKQAPGTIGLPHPSKCEYGPGDGGEPIPDWLNPTFDMFESIDQK